MFPDLSRQPAPRHTPHDIQEAALFILFSHNSRHNIGHTKLMKDAPREPHRFAAMLATLYLVDLRGMSIDQTNLQESMFVSSRVTARALIDAALERRLIEIRPSTIDKRSNIVALTPRGLTLLKLLATRTLDRLRWTELRRHRRYADARDHLLATCGRGYAGPAEALVFACIPQLELAAGPADHLPPPPFAHAIGSGSDELYLHHNAMTLLHAALKAAALNTLETLHRAAALMQRAVDEWSRTPIPAPPFLEATFNRFDRALRRLRRAAPSPLETLPMDPLVGPPVAADDPRIRRQPPTRPPATTPDDASGADPLPGPNLSPEDYSPSNDEWGASGWHPDPAHPLRERIEANAGRGAWKRVLRDCRKLAREMPAAISVLVLSRHAEALAHLDRPDEAYALIAPYAEAHDEATVSHSVLHAGLDPGPSPFPAITNLVAAITRRRNGNP